MKTQDLSNLVQQAAGLLLISHKVNQKDENNNFKLLPTLYPEDALEPYISKKTVEFHYGKHLAGYIQTTNNLKADTEYKDLSIEEIMLRADGKLFNNAAQVYNHYFQFEALHAPKKDNAPEGKIKKNIEGTFGNLDTFKQKFAEAATTLFGSGYVWLVASADGKLELVQTKNAENPLTAGKTPVLNLDVWEHAYYLDVQNLRAKYVENFWNIVDWEKVNKRLECIK